MSDFLAGVRAAAAVAVEHVDDVDRAARFPREGVDALKDARALSALADGVPFADVAEACRLLTETGQSVTEIMFAAGFQTKSNFNREFRRVKDMTPLAWRERNAQSLATPVGG